MDKHPPVYNIIPIYCSSFKSPQSGKILISEIMKINLVSFNPLAADVAGNARKAAELLRAPAPEADLIVLPEAALCGCPLFDLFDDKRLIVQNAAP